MTFISILFALLLEQLRPLRADNPVYEAIKLLALRAEAWFNAGYAQHGQLAWFAVMAILLVPTVLIYWLCLKLGLLLVLAFNIFVLYVTLGFRHYSHYFTSIQAALNSGDDMTARTMLAEWTRRDTADLNTSDIARIAVEKALVTSHRNVFGVFFWFLLPLGPAGAVLYRVAEYLARSWNEPDHMRNEEFGRFAAKAFYWIDWIPARLTATAFAIVGNFEDAIYAWRNFAKRWPNETTGVILSAGGGAMGIRLGTPIEIAGGSFPVETAIVDSSSIDADMPPGEEPGVRSLQSAVGLVWRALLLWMLLLLLLSMALWFG